MTVALAFKAFAKATPCLTPFLATSEPSVLTRILAYIRELLCSSNIFSKKSDPDLYSLYAPIVPAIPTKLSIQTKLNELVLCHPRHSGRLDFLERMNAL